MATNVTDLDEHGQYDDAVFAFHGLFVAVIKIFVPVNQMNLNNENTGKCYITLQP